MSTLTDLHRAVQATLASKRLGQPVFVRYLWHSLDKPDAVLPRLARLAETVTAWLGQTLERVKQNVEQVGGTIVGAVLNNVDINSDATYGYYTSYYGYYSGDGKGDASMKPGRKKKKSSSSTAKAAAPAANERQDDVF